MRLKLDSARQHQLSAYQAGNGAQVYSAKFYLAKIVVDNLSGGMWSWGIPGIGGDSGFATKELAYAAAITYLKEQVDGMKSLLENEINALLPKPKERAQGEGGER